MNTLVATIDLETRSACSLKKSGAWRYSLDKSTEILCMCFRLPHWKAGRTGLWTPMAEDLADVVELVEWIEAGELVEAHNAFFERAIWTNILTPLYGWPALISSQWRCSAAKSAACALPRALANSISALGLSLSKDLQGQKAMKKMSKPRKPRKKEREDWATIHGDAPMPLLWWESAELSETLYAYCRQDVLAEEALSAAIPDLSRAEQQMYQMDQEINERGFQLDVEAVSKALQLIASETVRLNGELAKVTNGQVKKATQRAQMLVWFEENGLTLPNTQAATIDEAARSEMDALRPDVRFALSTLRTLGRSSTAKYQAMQNWMCPDGRVRGGLLYHGATTGRWSGAGVQPHNFVRGNVKDMEVLWMHLKAM